MGFLMAKLPVIPEQFLTHCRQATRKLVIALLCGSRVSFSYAMPCTCFCQPVWLTSHFKVIDSLTLCRSYLKPYCMGRKTAFFQQAF